MSFGGERAVRRLIVGVLAGTAIWLIPLMLPSAASATVVSFCGKTYGGNEYCNQGHSHSIWWIEAQASADAFCVMRATEGWAGAPSASGTEYCASSESGGYVFQEFHGFGGYAQTHNKHSFAVSASPAFEYS
jgi:hypothetical protein